MRILVFDAQSYKFCLFIHTFIHNKLGIIKKGGICFQSAAFFYTLFRQEIALNLHRHMISLASFCQAV